MPQASSGAIGHSSCSANNPSGIPICFSSLAHVRKILSIFAFDRRNYAMTATGYQAMWEQLNLDIPAHEGLLAVLGKFYGDIYLSQSGLPGHGVS